MFPQKFHEVGAPVRLDSVFRDAPDGTIIESAIQSIRHLNQANRIFEEALLTRPAATADTTEPPYQLTDWGEKGFMRNRMGASKIGVQATWIEAPLDFAKQKQQ